MINTGEKYEWQGMAIISVCMVIGIFIIYFTWGGMEINYENFCNYIYKNGVAFIFSLFFIVVGLYYWKKYYCNVIIKPKKETLYLKKVKNSIYSFTDYKGKKYMYTSIDTREFILGNYYTVMKTKDIIKEVLELSNDKFPICKEKISYLLNYYGPYGSYENSLLLSLLYVIFLAGFFSFIISERFNKIPALLFMSVTGVLIVYDIIYKITRNEIIEKNEKIKKNTNIEYQNSELNKIGYNTELLNLEKKGLVGLNMIKPIIQIIVGLIFFSFCCWFLIIGANIMTRIVIIPFLICGLSVLIRGVVVFVDSLNEFNASAIKQDSYEYKDKHRKKYNVSNLFSKIYIVGFLIFLFGFLIVWCYLKIKEKSYSALLFSIPFWIAGIAVAYKNFRK